MATTSNELNSIRHFSPVVRELPREWSPRYCLARLQHLPRCLLLESTSRREALGRYSFLTADPCLWHEVAVGQDSNLDALRNWLLEFATRPVAGLPPFQGGLAGLTSYEWNRSLENLPSPRFDPLAIPALAWGLFDFALCWDHAQSSGWLISQGLPETDRGSRIARAAARAEEVMELLRRRDVSPPPLTPAANPQLPVGFGPQRRLGPAPFPTSNFSESEYLEAVEKCLGYIRAGDIFQVNLSQQLMLPQKIDSVALFNRLAEVNPATFAGYFDLGPAQILSASPERLASVRDRMVETRPIKGTRRRTHDSRIDLQSARELSGSAKDRAENTMIVDLMRNDLSRVCEDDSVLVQALCVVEQYETVMHLVSAITGRLRSGLDPLDLLAAIFPGGSVTGAPKIRAMEIITELEQTARGAYCGSLGYIGLSGDADFNILIRTMTVCRGWLQIPVGGAVVASSEPAAEYEETWTKAAGMLSAVEEFDFSNGKSERGTGQRG